MKRRSLLRITALGVPATLIVTACGGQTPPAPTSAATAASTAPTPDMRAEVDAAVRATLTAIGAGQATAEVEENTTATAVAAAVSAQAPTSTSEPPTATVAPPTATAEPPTATFEPPTETSVPATERAVPPTSTPGVAAETPEAEGTAAPIVEGRSRSAPLAFGTEIRLTTWSVTITEVLIGEEAWQAITAANEFADPPLAGREYILATLRLENISEVDEAEGAMFAVSLGVTGDGLVLYNQASVSPPRSIDGELFPGGSTTGQTVFTVPVGETNRMFFVMETFDFTGETARYVAIDEGASISVDPSLDEIEETLIGAKRSAPAAIDETVTTGGLELTLLEVVRGEEATTRVAAGSNFNDPAPEGMEYVLYKLRVRRVSTQDPDLPFLVQAGYMVQITGENNTIYDRLSVMTEEPRFEGNLYPGGQLEGWDAQPVPIGEKGLMIVFSPSFGSGVARYLSLMG